MITPRLTMITPKYDLPTAIRIGAKIRGQTRSGHAFHKGRSCAIGAAMEAETGEPGPIGAYDRWPEMNFQIDPEYSIWDAVIGLNDICGWTREEIAEWVDMVLP